MSHKKDKESVIPLLVSNPTLLLKETFSNNKKDKAVSQLPLSHFINQRKSRVSQFHISNSSMMP